MSRCGHPDPAIGYGFKPDPIGHLETLKALVGLTLTPSRSHNERYLPAVMNQGPTASCIGHGTAGAIVTACAAAGRALPWVPSPRGIYGVALAIERAEAGSNLTPLADIGAIPSLAMSGIAEWGLRPMQAPTSDGRLSDCEPSNISVEPRLDELEAASALELIGQHAITATSQHGIVEAIKTSLVSGWPVCMSIFADRALEDWDPRKGPLGAPSLSDPKGGPHWIFVYDYEVMRNGTFVALWQNSWGEDWGRNGRGIGTVDWLVNPGAGSRYVMAVRRS